MTDIVGHTNIFQGVAVHDHKVGKFANLNGLTNSDAYALVILSTDIRSFFVVCLSTMCIYGVIRAEGRTTQDTAKNSDRVQLEKAMELPSISKGNSKPHAK